MRRNFFIPFLAFVVLGVFHQVAFSQVNCAGEKIFTEKRCVGDEISASEQELFRIVNEYRAQNNLPQIPVSEALSLVANRHLLDLVLNVKSFTHGWSNCAYDINDQKTWDCIFESPKRLNSGYGGRGYENLFWTKKGNASAVLALEAWKKSDLHNSLLLNLKIFKNTKFDAFGIAINGQYAALWFGSSANAGQTSGGSSSSSANFAITFEKAISDLSNVLSFEKSSATLVNGKWSAVSADKSLMMQLGGKNEDITEATFSIKPEKNNQLGQKQKDVLKIFLSNAASEWSDRENWLNTSLAAIQANPKTPQTITLGKKFFVMSVDSQNNFSLSVKVNNKPAARQL